MQIITRDQVKAQLGITDSTYDTQIDAKLPIIDAKVKLICKNNFNYRFGGDMTNTSTTITAYSLTYNSVFAQPNYSGINNQYIYSDVSSDLEIGMQIEGDNIPTGAYITNITKARNIETTSGFISDVSYIEISDAVTATESGVTITGGFNIAHHPVVAEGVWWLIGETSTTICANDWISRSDGGMSVSRSDADNKIDGKSGMPAWFVKSLPRWHR